MITQAFQAFWERQVRPSMGGKHEPSQVRSKQLHLSAWWPLPGTKAQHQDFIDLRLPLCQQGYPICWISCLVLGHSVALWLLRFLGMKQRYPRWQCCSVVSWGAGKTEFPTWTLLRYWRSVWTQRRWNTEGCYCSAWDTLFSIGVDSGATLERLHWRCSGHVRAKRPWTVHNGA